MRQKYLLYPFAALAMLYTLTLFAVPVQAEPNLNTVMSITPKVLTEAQADVTGQPTPKQSTWGQVKVLYRGLEVTPNAMSQDSTSTTLKGESRVGVMASYGGDWSNNIISEAYYTLNKYRTGTSGVVYQGNTLSDWPYVASDPGALSTMTAYIGYDNRGGISGTWNGGSRGGYCKFFVDLVLYRSSYGLGGGNHLVLPGGTFNYSGYMPAYGVQQATRGMVIQRGGTNPHTAIVIANLGWGLDLIDSNFTGGNGNFVISRHALDWNQLSGYTAYRATYMRQF